MTDANNFINMRTDHEKQTVHYDDYGLSDVSLNVSTDLLYFPRYWMKDSTAAGDQEHQYGREHHTLG